MTAGKTVKLALLTAIALILFAAELQIPPVIPQIPGIKMGLANIITLFILYRKEYKAYDAILVVAARVLLSGLVNGSMLTLIFSLSGGLAATVVMAVSRKTLADMPPPIISVAGALTHNITQITVAAAVYGGFGVFLYLPMLILGGIASGLITGFAAAIIIRRVPK